MDSKTCTRCGATKEINEFPPKKRGAGGRDSWCRKCRRQYLREYSKRPEQAARISSYWKENTLRNRKKSSKAGKNASDMLADSYVKHALRKQFGLKAAEVTPEIIDLKRRQIEARRMATQLRKGIKDESI